ncbi:hypothetical protein QEN19_000544 [Hanseniaspora menglaensis]
MSDTSINYTLKESIPLYRKISDYELLLNQLVYKIDKTTLNLDDTGHSNKTNDFTLLEKIIEIDDEITEKFPYKEYDDINSAYENIKTELDDTNTELNDKILMTLYNNYKKLNSIKASQSGKTTLLKNIPLSTVINYSQRLSKFTSKPQLTIIDQSIIGEVMTPQPQDPSGWNFIWAGDDMIRRGNLVVQQQQTEIKQQKKKQEEEKLEQQRKQEEMVEATRKSKLAASASAGDGLMFDGKHKEKSTQEEDNNIIEEDVVADDDFDLDLFDPDEF